MKDLSVKLLEMAAMGGPFFSKSNLVLWAERINIQFIEEALKEGVDELYLAHFKSDYYYFKSRTKYEVFTGVHTLQNRKRFLKDRLQTLLSNTKTPPDTLAIMAMHIGAQEEAVEFWLNAVVHYFEFSAWFPAKQCIENAKLILLDKPRTEELKELESLYRILLTEFDHLDPLQQKSKEKVTKFTFPVSVGESIQLNPVKLENQPIPHLEEVEKAYILWAIESVGGNKTKAAKLMGINRTTLIMRMKKFGILGDD